jgi:hypothetical protein
MNNETSAAMNEAWRSYRAIVEEMREVVLAQPWAHDQKSRARIEYAIQEIQAVTYNHVIAPRPDYPSLYIQTAFQPVIYSCMMHPADFLNRRSFLDGRRRYRIVGKRGNSLFVDFQIINVYYGQDNPKNIGNYDLDKFAIDADGSFEIFLSAEPHPGNWIKLDPSTGDRNFLNIRESFGVVEGERGAEMYIERIDDAPGTLEFDEAALIDRLDRAARFYRFAVEEWIIKLNKDILDNVGTNQIFLDSFAANQGGGNNPSAIYPTGVWRLEPDEALILESEVPDAKYWNVQLGDICWRVLDYAYHQTCINNFHAHLNEDGRFRAIISHEDPGVANWLDPMDNSQGIFIFRFYRFDRPVTPTAKKVKLSEIWDHLPADTRRMSKEERAAKQVKQTRAVRARYREIPYE